jgi:hypothetical protein
MVLNAYLLHKENVTGRKKSYLQFTSSITEAIEEEWVEEKSFIPQPPGPAGDAQSAGVGNCQAARKKCGV